MVEMVANGLFLNLSSSSPLTSLSNPGVGRLARSRAPSSGTPHVTHEDQFQAGLPEEAPALMGFWDSWHTEPVNQLRGDWPSWQTAWAWHCLAGDHHRLEDQMPPGEECSGNALFSHWFLYTVSLRAHVGQSLFSRAQGTKFPENMGVTERLRG